MNELYIFHIHLMFNIFYSFIFIIYPYYIMWWFRTLVKEDADNYENFMYIPMVIHLISLILMFMILCKGLSKSIEYYYKIRYIEKKMDIKYRKIIDPYDEEEWNEKWVDKIGNNNIYNFLLETSTF